MTKPNTTGGSEIRSPAVDAHRRKVQLVFALKKQHFGPDFHNRWWVNWHSDGEERQLGMAAGSILTMEVLQSALETQGLEWM